ncbi:hypothetical protein HanXRQr2_Chr01g0040181 [Helianthus annuus]|uniref:Uncharacterized protein n=1 Tax=Helianthus annuus TaxID=4232 RepID=A0A9K3JYZ9_HELAN|nr:hypothetical protein HanXRQr2_Chr01g0040181 [Helianthus annuus]
MVAGYLLASFLPCSSYHGQLRSCRSCVIIPGSKKLKQWKPYTDLILSVRFSTAQTAGEYWTAFLD